MNTIIEELIGGIPEWDQMERVTLRLVVAMLLGAVIGLQREWAGKAAGLRTHMLVAMGSALFVLGSAASDMSPEDLSRVIQGIATGIGFIGAGAILKRQSEGEIQGLTTAAGIWMTSAVGVTVGLGRTGLAFLSMVLTWIVLAVIGKIEARMEHKISNNPHETPRGRNVERS